MPLDLCQEAVRDKRRTERDFVRWETMVQALGIAMTLAAIVTLVLLFVDTEDRTATLVAGAAAVASGGGFAFVLNRRGNARKEMEQANEQLKKSCAAPSGPIIETGEATWLPAGLVEALTTKKLD